MVRIYGPPSTVSGNDFRVTSVSAKTKYVPLVTGKKSRFNALASWEDFEGHDIKPLENIRVMFHFTQMTGGRYFGAPNDTSAAGKLKAAAAEAKGVADAELMTLEKFFEENFQKE